MPSASTTLHLTVTEQCLLSLVSRQVQNLFDLASSEQHALKLCLTVSLARVSQCFAEINNKYFHDGDRVVFSPFHSGQYTIFLYLLSRQIASIDPILADKLYFLNKTLNGVDLYHQVELPSVFFADHPVGTVIGRARFAERFYFSQNCTVGNNNGVYPTLGHDVYMMPRAMILGSSRIGSKVILAANAFVIDTDVPDGSIVFGQSPSLVIKPATQRHFDHLNFFRGERSTTAELASDD